MKLSSNAPVSRQNIWKTENNQLYLHHLSVRIGRSRYLHYKKDAKGLRKRSPFYFEAINDLSEDMRKELDNIYQAIAALSIKVPQANKPRNKIGYKTGDGE